MAKEIISDTISRNREFQEQQKHKVKRLKELGAPSSLIEYEEIIGKMTLAEYKLHCEESYRQEEAAKIEYAKNNPLQKSIVDEIYLKESQLKYDYFAYTSDSQFMIKLDPIKFMGEADYYYDLYRTFLDHAKKLYKERYLDEYKKDLEQRGIEY